MPASSFSYQFTHALTRLPALSVVDGLRAVDQGAPDAVQFRSDHQAYVDALEAAGIQVTTLPALEDFPDSVFIEDTALCLPQGAVILKPGAPSRAGETFASEQALGAFYSTLHHLNGDGFIEGGDILVTDREILVGLSDRTDAAGVKLLEQIVGAWGYTIRMIDVPREILHFKTDCGLLDGETVLSTARLAEGGGFKDYRVLDVPDGEETAANAIRVNGKVILSSGFPRTAEMLNDAGFDVIPVPTGQAALVDGGPSCQSLRFSV